MIKLPFVVVLLISFQLCSSFPNDGFSYRSGKNKKMKGVGVTVNLYYESLCPDCINFIVSQVDPTVKLIGHFFNMDYVPYGNADMNVLPNGTVSFRCQHGESECYGNEVQSCALAHYSRNDSSKFIVCSESSEDPPNAGPGCADKLALNYAPIKACVESDEGKKLMAKNGKRTSRLKPKHTFVPWITFNGVYNKDDLDLAQSDLLAAVCKNMKGKKPNECDNYIF